VLLGIRPEIFSVVKGNNSTGDIQGILTLTERLGSATNYYMESALSLDGRLVASMQGSQDSEGFEIGKEISFSISQPEVHFFDPETGLRII
jgi:ABC-type sugar transport system ATPase subunit